MNNFDIENVFASWWIVYIGITMAAITAPAFDLSQYGFIFFGIGFILMIPTLILVSYRYLKFTAIEDKTIHLHLRCNFINPYCWIRECIEH